MTVVKCPFCEKESELVTRDTAPLYRVINDVNQPPVRFKTLNKGCAHAPEGGMIFVHNEWTDMFHR